MSEKRTKYDREFRDGAVRIVGETKADGRAAGVEEERGRPAGPFADLEVIRVEAGMPTTRFCALLGIPVRSYRRWQAKARAGHPPKGPWPAPVRARHRETLVEIAKSKPTWGHRKVWATARHRAHRLSMSSVLRMLTEADLVQPADYQRERRKFAEERKAAFAVTPTRPAQVWQFDFSEFETIAGGTWRVAGVADYWSKYEFGWHWSPTANKYDAVAAVELAIVEAESMLGHPLAELCPVDPDTGEILHAVTLVTDNGGPFRSQVFATFIASRPEFKHIRGYQMVCVRGRSTSGGD